MSGLLPVVGSALVMLLAAVIAWAMPALRAARVDVMRTERASKSSRRVFLLDFAIELKNVNLQR